MPIGLVCVYFIAAKVGLMLASVHPSATAVWPPTGITLAAFLLFGYRVWPGIFMGAFLVNITTAGSTATSIAIAIGNTLEGLLGAYLVNRFANGPHALHRSRDVFKFALLATMMSTVVSPTFGVTSLSLGGFARWPDYELIWLTWWLRDAVGALVVAPVILLFSSRSIRWNRSQLIEAVFLFLSLILICRAIFGGLLPPRIGIYPYMCIPILFWTAFRFGQWETAVAALSISMMAVIGTLQGHGPFVKTFPNESLLSLQVFMGFITLMALSLAAVVREQKVAEDTLKKAHDKAMSQSEERFHLLVEAVKDYEIFMLDPDGSIATWNQGAERIEGYREEEIIGRNFSCFYTEKDLQEAKPKRLLEKAASMGKAEDEGWLVRKDGSPFMANVLLTAIRDEAGALLGFAHVARDISERRRTEELLKKNEAQIRQAQKMEAVGRLAGGVAHDFNNLLTGILGLCEISIRELPADASVREDLEEIKVTAQRAAKLTQQLLAFSRKQVIEPKTINLNDVIGSIGTMLRRTIGEDIELAIVPEAFLGLVRADPGQMEQLILNLAVNARDAMPEGGKLTIETANFAMDESFVRQHPGSRAGDYVMLAVSDNGTGMTDEIKTHIFEPFFTTKEKGKGTGLGLATCYGITKQNDGYISVYSELEKGTTFKVFLPLVRGAAADLSPKKDMGELPRGSETVLVVEDELVVKNLAVRVLRRQGYAVIEASDGLEAVRIVKEDKSKRIRLILTDTVMPKVGGKQLSEMIKIFRPDIQFIFSSGYTDDSIVRHGALEPGIQFLRKPFTPQTLTQKVREVLDRARPDHSGRSVRT